MARENSVEPFDDVKEFAAADWSGDDIDLIAESPDKNTPARWIQVVDIGAGTKLLVVRTPVSARASEDRSFTCVTNGEELEAKLTAIDTTSTVARVRVGW